MVRFIRPAMLAILLAFLVDSTISEADKFIGPKLYEATGKSTLLPTSSKTAIALKYEDIPHASASGDNEAKERMELLDFMENMVTNMKFVAKEFDRDVSDWIIFHLLDQIYFFKQLSRRGSFS